MSHKFIGAEEDLFEVGFRLYDEKHYDYDEDEYTLHNKYIYELGHSRRGQFYYYLIDMNSESKMLEVYASKPDGDGTSISLGIEVLKELIEKGLLVEA